MAIQHLERLSAPHSSLALTGSIDLFGVKGGRFFELERMVMRGDREKRFLEQVSSSPWPGITRDGA